MELPKLFCDICLQLNVTRVASVWCSECVEKKCEECEEKHQVQKATRHHETIAIKDFQLLPDSISNIRQECEVHKEKFEFYCQIHCLPLCKLCITGQHKECNELKPLQEIVKNVKKSVAFQDLENRVKYVLEIVRKVVKVEHENKTHIEGKHAEFIDEVECVKTIVNNHLDLLKQEIFNQLTVHQENTKSVIKNLNEMQSSVGEIGNELAKSKQHASDFQTFLCINEWVSKVQKYETEITAEHFHEGKIELTVKLNLIQEKIINAITDFGILGISFSNYERFTLENDRQMQCFIPTPNLVNRVKLANIETVRIPKKLKTFPRNIIRGCDMLADGRLVLVDMINKKLMLRERNGTCAKYLNFKTEPYDAAVIENTLVAVTLVERKEVVVIDLNRSEIQRSFPVTNRCFGIVFKDGKFYVCCDHKMVQVLNLSGEILSTLSLVEPATYCSMFNDRLYFATQDSTNEVYCCDFNGNVHWKFDCQESSFPLGIANDNSGNTFVTCRKNNTVILIGKNGTDSRILLSEEDKLHKPVAIYYNCDKNLLLVCNESGKSLLFDVSS
ncbi:uncharacterized protein LOC127723380 [Mytilus californianus]|uniref:uncharacterized protein LOC127723380 n=1 Tax=Mytilus californianus TaxID=6549 RepID=UPI00224731B2|nr:uncharacterized protein LOC127723380 [Mytilus californianus]XP_052085927.1 uncharacterized protein LOC127723380 [Mytilus californianus]